MSKKKYNKELAPEVVEDEILDEALETQESEDEIAVSEPTNAVDNSDQFIFEQLRTINRLGDSAKAKRLADRVLRNRKR